MSTQYWIAQVVVDLFRNEPKNVGVFVKSRENLVAKFYAETDENQFDGRKLRTLSYSDVYRQWVEYWRSQVESGCIDQALAARGSHYRVVEGGQVTDMANDAPEDVASYLYAMLVSEGGFREATRTEEEQVEQRALQLEQDITNVFAEKSLLEGADLFHFQHPIKRNCLVQGQRVRDHKPAFVQENGLLYVMETIDFTSTRKKQAQEHAGLSAYRFRDIRDFRSDAQTIAVIRLAEQDTGNDEVKYGLELIREEATSVVNWTDERERGRFLEDRRRVAMAS